MPRGFDAPGSRAQLGSDGIQQQKAMKNFFRVLSVVMLPVTAGFPAVRDAMDVQCVSVMDV